MVAGKGRRANLRADAKRQIVRLNRLNRVILSVLGTGHRGALPIHELTLEQVQNARRLVRAAEEDLRVLDEKLAELALRIDRGWL